MPNRRQSWPYLGQASSPPALTQTPDGLLNSERSLVGVLRLATAGGRVGPRGALTDGFRATDFGTDVISPRGHDPIGRIPYTAESDLISRKYR